MFVKGLCISWEDEAPLEPSSGAMSGTVTHRNPILRHRAADIMNSAPEWILTKAQFRWVVVAVLVFRYPNGVDQREEIEFKYRGKLCDMNETFFREFKSAMKYGENYSHTEICVECVGF
jgi:hypothetical protein